MLIMVTGASTGLGLNTANALTADGYDVVVHARTSARVPPGPWRGAVVGDLVDPGETLHVGEAANEFGRFDAVIHNAGALNAPDAVSVNIVAPYLIDSGDDQTRTVDLPEQFDASRRQHRPDPSYEPVGVIQR